jgi:hypothetical protein
MRNNIKGTVPHCLDILYFSRGRGRGHAVPDLAILRYLRGLIPDVRVLFASYGTGAEVFSLAHEPIADMNLDDDCEFLDVIVSAGHILNETKARLVVSHEEPAVLPAAYMFGLRSVFLIHWFGPALSIPMQALRYADEILFMEHEGLFPVPPLVHGKVRYVGPVVRTFEYGLEDRTRLRAEMGIAPDETVILVLPGSWTEQMAPCFDLILRAFREVKRSPKRLLWFAGKEIENVSRAVSGLNDITVFGTLPSLEQWMIAGDIAITKGTYNVGRELEAFGTPSISLSHGHNGIDDELCRTIQTNTFMWAAETGPAKLARTIDVILTRERPKPNKALLSGEGAAAVAARLCNLLSGAHTRKNQPL